MNEVVYWDGGELDFGPLLSRRLGIRVAHATPDRVITRDTGESDDYAAQLVQVLDVPWEGMARGGARVTSERLRVRRLWESLE